MLRLLLPSPGCLGSVIKKEVLLSLAVFLLKAKFVCDPNIINSTKDTAPTRSSLCQKAKFSLRRPGGGGAYPNRASSRA